MRQLLLQFLAAKYIAITIVCMNKMDASCCSPFFQFHFLKVGLLVEIKHTGKPQEVDKGALNFSPSARLKVVGILHEPVHGTSHIFFLIVASGSYWVIYSIN